MARKKAGAPAEAPEKKVTEDCQAETPEIEGDGAPQERPAEDRLETEEASTAAGTETRAAPVEEDTETAPVGRPAVVRAQRGLNLRVGPGMGFDVAEVLPDGTEVTALDLPMGAEVPGWRLVCAGETMGWVQSRFIRLRY